MDGMIVQTFAWRAREGGERGRDEGGSGEEETEWPRSGVEGMR